MQALSRHCFKPTVEVGSRTGYGRDPIARRKMWSCNGIMKTFRNGIVPKSSAGLDVQGDGEPADDSNKERSQKEQPVELKSWWQSYNERSKELKKRLLALGPAAVLAYGLFDGTFVYLFGCTHARSHRILFEEEDKEMGVI